MREDVQRLRRLRVVVEEQPPLVLHPETHVATPPPPATTPEASHGRGGGGGSGAGAFGVSDVKTPCSAEATGSRCYSTARLYARATQSSAVARVSPTGVHNVFMHQRCRTPGSRPSPRGLGLAPVAPLASAAHSDAHKQGRHRPTRRFASGKDIRSVNRETIWVKCLLP